MAAVASQAWDIADKVVGTVGGGRIGRGLIRRLRARPGPGMPRAPAAILHIHLQGSVCHVPQQTLSNNFRYIKHAPGMRHVAAEQECTLVY